jgi:hypothetical protein
MEKTSLEPRRPKHSKLAVLITILFAIGLWRLCPHYEASAEFPMHPEAIHLARSLALDHQFANPFRLVATGPSAYLSPAFPAFLALLLRIFGTGAKAIFAFRFTAAAATAAELALLPVLTELMGLGLSSGLVACAIGLLPPILTFPQWEMSYAGLLIVIGTILYWILLTAPKASFVTSALLGFTLGLLLLTCATVFPVLVIWLGYALWKFRTGPFRRDLWVVVIIVIVMLTPWTVRNYMVFHRFIPFRTALGLALEASDNDCASVGVLQSEASGCFEQHSPNYNFGEAARARSLGEAEYTAEKLHETVGWIRSHPARFATLTWQRIYAFWFPHESETLREEFTKPNTRRKERLIIYLATILSLPGLLALIKAHREAGFVLASWLIFFPPVYYIALFEDRYRYPILWVTFFCAAYALTGAARWLHRVVSMPRRGNEDPLKVV